MTDKSVHDATEEWVRHSITKEFAPIDINDVYKAFAAGAQWQSQQAQGEPVGKVMTVGGYPDESEHTVEWLCKYKDLKDGDLLYTASPAPDHSGDGNEMVGWISVNEQTPSQGERVLLKIDLEDCPVVGYWGCGRYEACTVNMEVSCGAFCYGGNVDSNFSREEVTHWMPLPNPPQQEETER